MTFQTQKAILFLEQFLALSQVCLTEQAPWAKRVARSPLHSAGLEQKGQVDQEAGV